MRRSERRETMWKKREMPTDHGNLVAHNCCAMVKTERGDMNNDSIFYATSSSNWNIISNISIFTVDCNKLINCHWEEIRQRLDPLRSRALMIHCLCEDPPVIHLMLLTRMWTCIQIRNRAGKKKEKKFLFSDWIKILEINCCFLKRKEIWPPK